MIHYDADHGSSREIAIVLVLVIAIVAILIFGWITMVHDLTTTELSTDVVDRAVSVAGSLVSLHVYFHGY